MNISLSLNKYPSMTPFWSIFYIKIGDQEDKVFIEKDHTSKRLKKIFSTIFPKSTFISNTTITYKIIQIPSYICSLENDGCVCYLNCGIQLLFHLSKFRSFLFSTFIDENENDWLKELINLFKQMCVCKTHISNEELTESFGWPTSARRIQHDSSEFVQIILEKIDQKYKNNKNKKEEFEQIFISKISYKNEFEKRYIFNLLQTDENESLFDTIQKSLVDSKFVKFPEVLFLTTSELSSEKVTEELDLSSFSTIENNGQFVLCGVIIRIPVKNNAYHFTSFVRASIDDIWLYFNDTMQMVHNFQYNKKLKRIEKVFDSQIKKKLNEGQIHLLMYIRKDVLGQYFTFTPVNSKFQEIEKYYNGKERLIMITKVDDIKRYVESGRTDFEDVESSICFEIDEKKSFSDVYQKVAEIEKKPIGSFTLRSVGNSQAPSKVFQNDPNSFLSNYRIYKLRFYYEEVKISNCYLNQYIPYYFLLFKFKPKHFLNEISDILVNRKIDLTQSTPIPMFTKKKLGRQKSSNMNKRKKIKKNSPKKLEKNCFQYLTCIVLKTSDTFESVIDELLKIINEKDKNKKHTKINLYSALYDVKEKEKIRYNKIPLNKPICKCFQQTFNLSIFVGLIA